MCGRLRCVHAVLIRCCTIDAHVSPESETAVRQDKASKNNIKKTAKRWSRLRGVARLGAAAQMSADADAITLASAKIWFLN